MRQFYNNVNGHGVYIVDRRPIGKKRDKQCVTCGKTGLRLLKKEKCFR